ncbi:MULTISPECIES: class I SAM-dependent methyltransferase [Halorussus]|uniref:class I SAM-dependent methyltransferase n=1 Tax=Halorussus TaxID=1070314 RepID=UPI000E2100CB|nr:MULTISPECIES: class I SAM-dependent methyltransferase [Halorussus]NHN57780.1 class I SAM-dependent methyltransferase [Halorussus sp. JP-T4]
MDDDRQTDSDPKRAAMDAFAAAADAYRDSDVHRSGEDLDLLAEWCAGASRALDVACGPGNAAGALADAGVPSVVATDATPEMVRTATDSFPVDGAVADAERLPFAGGAFDAVTCRIAAHHFPDPRAFLRETARVLEPGGGERTGGPRASSDLRSDAVLAFEDNVAPEDDRLADFFDEFERTRDPSHVEAYPQTTWESWFREAGFEVEETLTMTRELDYEAWVDRTDPDEDDREKLAEMVRKPAAKEVYGVSVEDGEVQSFSNRKVLIRATVPE